MELLTIDVQFPLVLAHGPLSLDDAVKEITAGLGLVKHLTDRIPQKEYFRVGTRNHESELKYARQVSSALEAVGYVNQVCPYLFQELAEVNYGLWVRAGEYQASVDQWLKQAGKTPNKMGCIFNKI